MADKSGGASAKTNEKEAGALDVYPLKRGKRILSCLADTFICFLLAFTLFHLAVSPLGKLAYGYDDKVSLSEEQATKRDAVLYRNNLLFSEEGDESVSAFTVNLENTFDLFASYYVVDGTSADYEVLRHYAIDIRGSSEMYASYFSKYDTQGFFNLSGSAPVLNERYVAEFAPNFDEKDTMSDTGKKDYESFRDDFFIKAYGAILTDAAENEGALTYNGDDYAVLQESVSSINAGLDSFTSVCAGIAYLLSMAVCFVLFPMLLKNRRTMAMALLNEERIDIRALAPINRPRALLVALYDVFGNMWGLLFTPMFAVGFNELFALPGLFIISLIGLLYDILSLAFILISPLGSSLTDKLSQTVLVTDETLDKIYRKRGYPI
jgi:hypothetical protein